ncbi:SAGA complex subunit 1 [Hibiscus trionum]|uniref:SAGA complex subunit 1 n=1 Tax=Hibiscus trionum TaxID=183268 RepID=A0A9W7LSI2_HIBTR|nr:SAGA complex subunit 1 [Hibiscus trionum]
MLSSGNNLSRGNAGLSSDMPPLPHCLPLEPISLGSQKYTRSGELSRVLGVPLRSSTSDDHSFGVSHPKPSPPVATEELKNFKESVQDTSRKARDRVKRLRESISKLDRYKEALSSKKRQRSDISSERTSGVNITKMGSQIHRNGHDLMTQRLEDRPKSMGLNKRVRTSVADLRADNRIAVNPRQQGTIEKESDVLSAGNGGSARMEEKIRRLPGEGWETKMKRKRSVAAVGNRVAGGDRDIKRVMQPKLSSESKLRSCDIQGFRSKSSLGASGIRRSESSVEASGSDASTVLRNESESTSIPRDRAAMLEQRVVVKANNKATLQDDNQASSPSTMLKGKVSRAPRTGSIMVLDSSSKVHLSSGALQGWEQPNLNKIQPLGVGSNQKRLMSTGSSPQAMSQWGGQRPHKNSRTRRTNLVSPSNAEAQISNQGFTTPDFGARASIGAGGSLLGSSVDNAIPRIKREPENVSSPFGFSESEESGAGDNKSKEKGIHCNQVLQPTSHKAGSFLLPTRKNKMFTNEIGDGVRRQGRSGGSAPSLTKPGIPPMREKLENITTTKPIQSARSASDKNRSKTGRPPSKKLKDCKATTRVGVIQSNVSSDCIGESDDDRDELFAAATAARNATSLACSGPFWKKMGSIFNSVSSEDTSYLRQQLNLAEGLDESLSQMFGDGYTVLGGVVPKDAPTSVEEVSKTNTATGGFDLKQFDKVTPLYQRVLSALIEEDESEELYNHTETKNMSLHYASDDSHCDSCNHMDVEFKDRDRIESEVESNTDFQCQKNSLLDRLSYDASIASNTFRNSSMSNSLHSSERWLGDEFSHSDMGPVSEICSTDLGQVQPKEISISAVSSLDGQYQLMSIEDKLLLELHSIGLYPETLPDLTEGEEAINQNVVELNGHLYQQIQKKKKKLGNIDKAIQNGREADRRNIEHAAMDQLIQMANKKRLACRGGNSSKSALRKVSKQVALAFIKRTLDRCRKFEQTGNSCFNEPALQDVMFSVQPSSNEAKTVECIGSGTASNTCNETSNHQAEARGSGAVCCTFERYDSPDAPPAVHSEHAVSKYGSMLNKGRKREVPIDDVVGSASSRVTLALDNIAGGLRGNRCERERQQSRDNLRNTSSVSGAGRASLDGPKGDQRTKAKPKQKSNLVHGFNGMLSDPSLPPLANTNRITEREASNIRPDSSKEADESADFANLQLTELDPMEELGVSNDIGGPQDLSSWLNFDEDGLQDHDSIGLEIPMDDLSDLKFAF